MGSSRELIPVGFDGAEAQRWIVEQCSFGPRVAGMVGHGRCLERMVGYLESLGLEVRRELFSLPRPGTSEPREFTNLFVPVRPGVRPRLLLGAHWDTRPWCDEDPDPAARDQPVLGANDGASGTAVLLTLARILSEHAPPIGIDLAFFDAEDMGSAERPQDYALGSQRMVNEWQGALPDWVVVLDMVGHEKLEIGVELFSQEHAPQLVELVFSIAAEKGYAEWNPETADHLIDDHTPFLVRGVPSTAIVGYHDPHWHTRTDVPEHTSAYSLGRVGDVAMSLIYEHHLALSPKTQEP